MSLSAHPASQAAFALCVGGSAVAHVNVLLPFVNFLSKFFQFIAKALQFELALFDFFVQLASLSFQRLEMVADYQASRNAQSGANHRTGTDISGDAADARADKRTSTAPTPTPFSRLVTASEQPRIAPSNKTTAKLTAPSFIEASSGTS